MEEAEKLIASLQAQGHPVSLAGPPPEEAIAELERVLAVRLPPGYRALLARRLPPSYWAFLARCGAAADQGARVSGIIPSSG
jgi:hypothetical protein